MRVVLSFFSGKLNNSDSDKTQADFVLIVLTCCGKPRSTPFDVWQVIAEMTTTSI